MEQIGFLFTSIVKILAILAYLYGLLKVLGHPNKWVKIAGVLLAFGIIQAALTFKVGGSAILNDFDKGLLFQSCTMSMVALGLNLIYGFNGQFSLAQWGFYGIGAYTAADITYRWFKGDARGMLVVGFGVLLGGLVLWGLNRLLRLRRGIPVLSQFTLYLIGSVLAGFIAVKIGAALNPLLTNVLGTNAQPGPLNSDIAQYVVYFLAVIFAGLFSAEVGYLFGLPVFTLGSDYFGIATLGFAIVVNTLMTNSDTILPFPEMKGGRGMVGIPQMTNWAAAFFFLILVIIIMRNIIHSSTGRATLSVREDETAAKAMGIDITSNKLMIFAIGCFFAGVGGAVYAHYIAFLSPGTFNFLAGFNPLIIVVFGGLGSMTGTLTAAFGWMFFLEGLLRVILGYLGTEAPSWRYVLYPITLLLLMLLRPQGLLGTVEWGFFKAKPVPPRKRDENVPARIQVADEGGKVS